MNPSTNQTEMSVYGSNATYKSEPQNIAEGHVPLDTLPAAWWNWLWNQITKNNNASLVSIENMRDELKNVLDAAGITPSELSDNQLYSAIEIIRKRVATVSDPGAVLSSSDLKSISVGNDGLAVVNALADWTESVTVKSKLDALSQALADGYKPKQTAVTDPAASGTTITAIDTISQDENGVITPTKKTIRSASTSQTGIVQLANTLLSTSTTMALTAAQGKALADRFNLMGFRYSSTYEASSSTAYCSLVFSDITAIYIPTGAIVGVLVISSIDMLCTPTIITIYKTASAGIDIKISVSGVYVPHVRYYISTRTLYLKRDNTTTSENAYRLRFSLYSPLNISFDTNSTSNSNYLLLGNQYPTMIIPLQ